MMRSSCTHGELVYSLLPPFGAKGARHGPEPELFTHEMVLHLSFSLVRNVSAGAEDRGRAGEAPGEAAASRCRDFGPAAHLRPARRSSVSGLGFPPV